jgi:hypothetical protein
LRVEYNFVIAAWDLSTPTSISARKESGFSLKQSLFDEKKGFERLVSDKYSYEFGDTSSS